jgi:hypothetical protein
MKICSRILSQFFVVLSFFSLYAVVLLLNGCSSENKKTDSLFSPLAKGSYAGTITLTNEKKAITYPLLLVVLQKGRGSWILAKNPSVSGVTSFLVPFTLDLGKERIILKRSPQKEINDKNDSARQWEGGVERVSDNSVAGTWQLKQVAMTKNEEQVGEDVVNKILEDFGQNHTKNLKSLKASFSEELTKEFQKEEIAETGFSTNRYCGIASEELGETIVDLKEQRRNVWKRYQLAQKVSTRGRVVMMSRIALLKDGEAIRKKIITHVNKDTSSYEEESFSVENEVARQKQRLGDLSITEPGRFEERKYKNYNDEKYQ